MYIDDKMSQEEKKKIRIGRKEKKILEFLQKVGGSAWKSEIIEKFSWTSRYDKIVIKRLERMARKGLIEIRTEINPSSGRSKQRVYLKQ